MQNVRIQSNNTLKQTTFKALSCGVLLVYLLLAYNGLWNLALYSMPEGVGEITSVFVQYCMMITPASAIAVSLGGISTLEIVCTITDNEWKSVVQMLLWSLLTILLNSFTAYLISKGMGNSIEPGVALILIGTTVINIIWYLQLLSVLKKSKYWNRIIANLEKEESDEMDEDEIMETEEVSMENRETKSLAFDLLMALDCAPKETADGRIQFNYQGVKFFIEATNGCMFVNLLWPWCYSFSKFDVDKFARVRQVVNEINLQGVVSVFYTITDSDEVALHIKKNFLLIVEIPKLDTYLRIILDSFFSTTRTLDLEIEKLKILD